MTDTAASPSASPAAPGSPATSRPRSRRRLLLSLLALVVILGAMAYALYYFLVASHYVSTDNAYVGADSAQVTPLIAGPVEKVLVSETQSVKAGQPLVVLDASDAQIAVEEAQAALGQAQRRVKGYYAQDVALAGQVAARGAEITRADAAISSAQADLNRARIDLNRRQALAASGAVSGDELTDAQNRFATAQAALSQAQASRKLARATQGAAVGTRQVNTALISGVGAGQNPEVAAAQSRLDAARLALSRTVLRAPMAGVVSRKNVQVGQQVQVGAPLMVIVPETTAYVDANFKEVQLERVRIGQPAVLTSDLYGKGVTFHGRVVGLSGGTGSAFSLIPAQNASGNWIKVVQRLPVRIAIDPQDLRAHPLRVGLSMKTKIDLNAAPAR